MNTILIILMATLASPFTNQNINEIEIGAINPYTGTYTTNFRLHDMNRDGLKDLVFTDHVRIQENGLFPQVRNILLPQIINASQIDIFDGKLYFKGNSKIHVFELQDMEWKEIESIDTPWPFPENFPTSHGKDWGSFILDLDGDSKSEIIHGNIEGLEIIHLDQEQSPKPIKFAIFPKAKLSLNSPKQNLSKFNNEAAPEFELSFRCLLENNNFYIIEQIPFIENQQRFSVQRFTSNNTVIENIDKVITSPLKKFMQPCRIDNNEQIDYAGGIIRYQSNTALTTPIYEFLLTTDSGKTIQSYHSKSFFPHTYFLDYNQDGLKDILMEETRLTDGGMRQTVSRLATQRKLSHRIHIYLQQIDGAFPPKPTLSKDLTIRLDKAPINKTTMFQRYQNGFLVNAIGNLNGDNFSDLVVQSSPEQLDMYFGNISGYMPNPQIKLDIDKNARFYIIDINGDNNDDIVVSQTKEDPSQISPEVTVYFSPKEQKYNE